MEIKEEKVGDIANGTDPKPTAAPAVITPDQPQIPVEPLAVEPKIDYQALYEQEAERRSKAEYTLYKRNKDEKAKRQQAIPTSDPTAVVDHEMDKKLIEQEVVTLLEAQRQKDAEDVIEEEIMALSTNEDEKRLIRFKYDNGINKTGYSRLAIRQDLQDAWFLANKTRFIKERGELTQTAIAKKTTGNSGVGTNSQKPAPVDDLSKQFTAQDWNFMQKRKWSEAQIREALQNRAK